MYKESMKVFVEGQGEIELYTIGYLAKNLKKSVETIRAWERQRVIPRPMYERKGVRLYHTKEIETMKKVLRKLGKQPKKKDIQKAMWSALKETRLEIINKPKEEQAQETT